MASAFTYPRRVEFAETDMAGIVHFAQFFRYMEEAEHAFWRHLGMSVHQEIDGRVYSFARVHARCDYQTPLHFEDQLEIRLTVREKTGKAITFGFAICRREGDEVAEAARGQVRVLCVRRDEASGRYRAAEIPARIAEQIEVDKDSCNS